MKKLFNSTAKFDAKAVEMGLSELVLQENAARAVADLVREKIAPGSKVVALCGGGNNGADAIAAVRMLAGDFRCEAVLTRPLAEGTNAAKQAQIASTAGVKIISNLISRDGKAAPCDGGKELPLDPSKVTRPATRTEFSGSNLNSLFADASCVIDGIFGSGLRGEMDSNLKSLLAVANEASALKIAVDFPSGLNAQGAVCGACFKADFTVTMGARKIGLYGDLAKDFAGEIVCASLGLSNEVFASESEDFLLEWSDLELPSREAQNVNKGDFGHAFALAGAMSGAAQMCALAALNMGAGRVSVVGDILNLNPQIMQKRGFAGATAVSLGMGLGRDNSNLKLSQIYPELSAVPCVVDADMFYRAEVLDFATRQDVVLTPHPKEFAALLSFAGLGEFDTSEIARRKFELARLFSRKFPATLVLKGANTIIAKSETLYVCPLGSNKLAVGGSGDVLSGIILAYLAQCFSPLRAAINGVIAHAKTAANYGGAAFSFTPNDMIGGLKWL